jgi:type II secretory pathway component PulJ
MSTSATVLVVLVAVAFITMLGLIVHATLRDRREEAERLRKKMAMTNYVDEVEQAMRANKRLTDPEAVRRFHDALGARRNDPTSK